MTDRAPAGSQLVAIARAADASVGITAKTEPQTNASTRILQKLGFQRDGEVTDADIGTAWAWRLD